MGGHFLFFLKLISSILEIMHLSTKMRQILQDIGINSLMKPERQESCFILCLCLQDVFNMTA